MITGNTISVLSISALFLGVFSPAELVGKVRVHRDLGGFTTWVGKVQIVARNDGRVRTSIPVGRFRHHSSNYGVQGLSYYTRAGRFDSLSAVGGQSTHARYLPYKSPLWLYRRAPQEVPAQLRRKYGTPAYDNRIGPYR